MTITNFKQWLMLVDPVGCGEVVGIYNAIFKGIDNGITKVEQRGDKTRVTHGEYAPALLILSEQALETFQIMYRDELMEGMDSDSYYRYEMDSNGF